MSKKNNKLFFLILTVIAGLITIWPFHNFQYFLSQGDHGRDLYCFKKTLEGALPYRDYSWLFGPLMPYYYSSFMAVFGVSIQSVLLGQNILLLATGVLIFLICSVFMSGTMSFLTAASYWIFRSTEFFYTYNHTGGLFTIMLSFYCLVKYIDKEKKSYLYGGFFSLFLLTLIRLNMGIVCLAAFFLILCLSDHIKRTPNIKKRIISYFSLAFMSFFAAALIYFILVSPLPVYILKQCFPYFKPQRPLSLRPSIFESLKLFTIVIKTRMSHSLINYLLGFLFIISAIHFVESLFKNRIKNKEKMLSYISAIFLYTIFISHEFFLSGVDYRIFWFFPFIVLIFFLFLDMASKKLHPVIRFIFLFSLVFLACVNGNKLHKKIQALKTPEHHLRIEKNDIYTLQNQEWIKPVQDTVIYIKKNIKKDETILVMPFDPLYLFLSERDSATRQLVFFNHMGITEEQQKKIISEMSDKNANWLILSNRSRTDDPVLGSLGETYCVTLGKYLLKNFEFKAQFGDWEAYPGWAWKHGIRIFRKKQ